MSFAKSTVVNALTISRVPLVLLWAVLAVVSEFTGSAFAAVAACAAMLFSGLTDLWDGRLARKWGVVSAFGKMADPLMDKIFYLVAFPTLVWLIARQGESSAHALAMLGFTVLYLLRDTWVTFLRSVGAMYGADVAAMWLGKVRTALSFPGAGWVYVYLAFHRFVPDVWGERWLISCYAVEFALGVLTVVSVFTYTAAYMPSLRKSVG